MFLDPAVYSRYIAIFLIITLQMGLLATILGTMPLVGSGLPLEGSRIDSKYPGAVLVYPGSSECLSIHPRWFKNGLYWLMLVDFEYLSVSFG